MALVRVQRQVKSSNVVNECQFIHDTFAFFQIMIVNSLHYSQIVPPRLFYLCPYIIVWSPMRFNGLQLVLSVDLNDFSLDGSISPRLSLSTLPVGHSTLFLTRASIFQKQISLVDRSDLCIILLFTQSFHARLASFTITVSSYSSHADRDTCRSYSLTSSNVTASRVGHSKCPYEAITNCEKVGTSAIN